MNAKQEETGHASLARLNKTINESEQQRRMKEAKKTMIREHRI